MDTEKTVLLRDKDTNKKKIQRRHLITGFTALGLSAGGIGTAVVLTARNSAQGPKSASQSPARDIPKTDTPDIPTELMVPPGHVLLLQAFGKGVQIYALPVSNTTAPTPHAILSKNEDVAENLVAIHYAGPTWEALDGSKVVGQKLTSTPAPDGKSVPWLLLAASSHEGNGLLSQVTYIQRISTKGGIAPANSGNQGEVLAEYSALDLFYTAQS